MLSRCLMIVVAVAVTACAAHADVLFVDDDATPGGDGSSWNTAFESLQDALAAAAVSSGVITEIWVAAGVYRPTEITHAGEPRSAAFQLQNGLAVYGGFAGDESSLDQRDPSVNFTFLSGDLGLPVVSLDDAYHVVVAGGTDATAVLDGFIITSGNADGTSDREDGGGLYAFDGSPSISNCQFANNFAGEAGGAVFIFSGSPSFTNCAFTGNTSDWFGGAIWCGADLQLIGCDFTSNTADQGGAVSIFGSLTATDCTFLFNTATVDFGGAINGESGADVTLENCLFLGNEANELGGGFHTCAGPGPEITLVGCVFSGNIAEDGGGLSGDDTSLSLTDCLVTENFATRFGGGIFISGGSLTAIGTELDHNLSQQSGAGLHATAGAAVDLQQCDITLNWTPGFFGGGAYIDASTALFSATLFDGNRADDFGAALYSTNGASVSLSDCTFENNVASRGAVTTAGGTSAISGCDFLGNIGSAGPAMLNTGDAVVTVTDCLFSGNTASVNSGAVRNEMDSQTTFTDCTFTQNNAPQTGALLCFGQSQTTIISSTFSDHTISGDYGAIRIEAGQLEVSGCTFTNNSANSAGAIQISSTSVATIMDSVFSGNTVTSGGGAIVCGDDTVVTISGCTFEDNTSGLWGGAMRTGPALITDCVFTGNIAQTGGALNIRKTEPTVTRCMFSGNSAQRGGAIDIDPGSGSGGMPTFVSCAFLGNSADNDAGAFFSRRSNTTPLLVNCLFSGNTCGGDGAGLYSDNSSPTLINCTLAGNTASGNGGGMFTGFSAQTQPVVHNCIFWGNTDALGMIEASQIFDSNGTSTVNYTDVQGLTGAFGGVGNIGIDPLFVDPAGTDSMPGTEDDNLRLEAGSPCIDAADNTAVPVGITTDLDGHPRFLDVPETADTGNGDPPIVDMGAYESLGGGCLAIVNQEVICHADGSLFTYNVEGLSSCTGDTMSFSFTGSAGAVGEDFCFTVMVNDQSGFCCSTTLCVPVPDCSQPACPCDLDGDEVVGITDFFEVLAAWGPNPGNPADFNSDDFVGILDLFEMFGNWGPCS